MGIEVNTLHPLFAAELIGVDCARPDAALVNLVEDLMRKIGGGTPVPPAPAEPAPG